MKAILVGFYEWFCRWMKMVDVRDVELRVCPGCTLIRTTKDGVPAHRCGESRIIRAVEGGGLARVWFEWMPFECLDCVYSKAVAV